ncbi:hypothetical protein [Streptomyces sp. H27-C3]|uniref:hypothetical protein n=1 Tax=Streptomyces sp. H27-C3 TaxID=3046305 RepID=UPI0024BB2E2D|nr:hypothetical protein [Streptomyces sp. H27-C3]MDJ0463823.1 hypothetical protein [Streptomyces sp. H27-C3]
MRRPDPALIRAGRGSPGRGRVGRAGGKAQGVDGMRVIRFRDGSELFQAGG